MATPPPPPPSSPPPRTSSWFAACALAAAVVSTPVTVVSTSYAADYQSWDSYQVGVVRRAVPPLSSPPPPQMPESLNRTYKATMYLCIKREGAGSTFAAGVAAKAAAEAAANIEQETGGGGGSSLGDGFDMEDELLDTSLSPEQVSGGLVGRWVEKTFWGCGLGLGLGIGIRIRDGHAVGKTR